MDKEAYKALESVQAYCKEHTSRSKDGARTCDKNCMYKIDSWCRWYLAFGTNPDNWCLYHLGNLK